MHSAAGLANPGLPDGRLAARARGLDAFAGAGEWADLTIVTRGHWWGPRRLAFRLRQEMARMIDARVEGASRPLLHGLILGERAGIGRAAEDGFRAAGATHILSVSGLHLATVAAMLYFVLRRLVWLFPRLALRHNPGALAAGLAIPGVLFYALLTGEAVATLRSAIMAVVGFAAVAARRPFSFAASAAIAAATLLAGSPFLLLDVSFQLSFVSVIALALFGRALIASPPRGPAPPWRRALRWLLGGLAASTAAALVTGPLVAHHFGEVTPAAPIGNLVLVPLVELWVVPLGLVGAVVALVSPVLGAVPLLLAAWGAQVALWVAEVFRTAAPVVLVASPGPATTFVLVTASAALLAAVGAVPGRRRPWLITTAICLALAGGAMAFEQWRRFTRETLEVTFLDVGQGDAAVIEGPRGFTALIDGGGTYDGAFDPGERVVEPFLRSRGIRTLDLVALSHPHPDHLNGLLRIMERFPVRQLWTSGDDGRNPMYTKLLALARAGEVATPTPGLLARNAMELRALGPWLGDRIGPPPGVSVNDASLVVRLSYAGRSLLFSGDLELDGEAELVARGGTGLPVRSDVLKVPHHGSRTSSTSGLLEAVGPSLAVISLGRQNRFGFPRPEVLERYGERHIRVLRTDLDGAVTVRIEKNGAIEATCVRPCR